ncbi:MAG: SPOR domain-containing protein [Cypionkella sp.]|uniref:SPOR domain-containing protein n=1 Tax=Cypionkella sp. TaxID=2811411 RepID=UPI002ABCA7F9|nr:SPOR domain-containing protein [Cypionkella sp.]MDZ4311443.1 SPOR domain-containing protein [Cypionkella sp.]
MLLKIVSVAVFAAVLGPIVASAQTVSQIGQPAERPPASYKGAQYVDSRGCVFMNANYGGAAQWVARVNRSRKVLCGYPPTFGPKPVIEMADETPAAKPVVVAAAPVVVKPAKAKAPMATVASAMMPEAVVVGPAPVPRARVAVVANLPTPVQSYERAATSGPAAGKIGCYSSAPVAEVVRLRNGGTAVVCTRGDGTLTGWRPPIYPRGAGVGAALSEPVQVARADHAGVGRVAVASTYASAELPEVAVPKGYKLAWTDDRLNPQRGIGTAQGQAAQDQLWTRTVPARLVTDVQKTKVKKRVAASVTVSSKGQAELAPKAARGGAWVQIGTFGVASNAAGAAAQLQALGLPVAKSKLNRGGKNLQIVMAGPFGSAAEAQTALRMARGAGFGDAYIR